MVNHQVFPIRDQEQEEQAYTAPHNIAAIEVIGPGREGSARLGAVMQLPSSARVEICGRGFNDRTVKIRSNGHYYFVFWQDLMACAS